MQACSSYPTTTLRVVPLPTGWARGEDYKRPIRASAAAGFLAFAPEVKKM